MFVGEQNNTQTARMNFCAVLLIVALNITIVIFYTKTLGLSMIITYKK